uniref:Uncharacterized protein n=1 Tax=Caenorhabditis japonica TaxID=281687 RepID=A0A8R1EJT2_CAEJA
MHQSITGQSALQLTRNNNIRTDVSTSCLNLHIRYAYECFMLLQLVILVADLPPLLTLLTLTTGNPILTRSVTVYIVVCAQEEPFFS